MSVEAPSPPPPVVSEIADLLDQCTQEELANILATIEGGGLESPLNLSAAASPRVLPERQAAPKPAAPPVAPAPAPVVEAASAQPAANLAPVPPAAPPPGAGRRPNPSVKRSEASPGEEGTLVSMEDLKRILDEHSAGVLTEVRKLLPMAMAPSSGFAPLVPQGVETIDMGALTQALLERDREVERLEARLSDLQTDLALKDKRVSELGSELDQAVREVRHRQLDLEFQQLKLEERVRSNAELEQAQRSLTARVEEASLSARHAALDLDLCRSTPRGIRAQGTLPWTLRKNRPGVLPAMGNAADILPR